MKAIASRRVKSTGPREAAGQKLKNRETAAAGGWKH